MLLVASRQGSQYRPPFLGGAPDLDSLTQCPSHRPHSYNLWHDYRLIGAEVIGVTRRLWWWSSFCPGAAPQKAIINQPSTVQYNVNGDIPPNDDHLTYKTPTLASSIPDLPSTTTSSTVLPSSSSIESWYAGRREQLPWQLLRIPDDGSIPLLTFTKLDPRREEKLHCALDAFKQALQWQQPLPAEAQELLSDDEQH